MARRGKKREQRKREHTRPRSGSPYRLIGSSGELVACYINKHWEESGQAAIYVLRRVPGGGHALASFLVDLWCVGLKDAWGRLDMSYQEFNEFIQGPQPFDHELIKVDLETVARVVRGGIRFAEQNGFRLPPRCDRWVALLGESEPEAEVDLSDFGVDGHLRYMGTYEDLKQRLIGCRPEEFLARKDVEYVLGDGDFTPLDDAEEVVEEVTERLRERGLGAVRQWCFANGIAPHPRLSEAWDVMIEAMMQVEVSPEEDEFSDATVTPEAVQENMAALISLGPAEIEDELLDALDQIQSFMEQFESADEMWASLGLDEEFLDEEE
ncbi:MAG: hypothetical protein KAY37_01365 [Phycisphaerae bacterium]|nr:hypothetical protein [Phycisphaerae bacterium]